MTRVLLPMQSPWKQKATINSYQLVICFWRVCHLQRLTSSNCQPEKLEERRAHARDNQNVVVKSFPGHINLQIIRPSVDMYWDKSSGTHYSLCQETNLCRMHVQRFRKSQMDWLLVLLRPFKSIALETASLCLIHPYSSLYILLVHLCCNAILTDKKAQAP